MGNVKSPVAGSAEVRVHDSEKAKAKRSWLYREQKSEVELVTFPKFVPAPSRDELIDIATAYNSSLGW